MVPPPDEGEALPQDVVGEERLQTLQWASIPAEHIQELNASSPLADYQAVCAQVPRLERPLHPPQAARNGRRKKTTNFEQRTGR